jgi:Phosphoesterase family
VAPPRIVVLMQENKTTDFYFPTLAAWGADVENRGGLLSAPPDFDQPHDRNAWVHCKLGDYPAARMQVDNDVVIPYYSFLAKEFTFCDHHFGLGSNSTSGHMLAIGGQTPTLRNPPSTQPPTVWDLPTIFKHAERGGYTWGAFPDDHRYPVRYYAELADPSAAGNVHAPAQFLQMARSGKLPQLCFVWSPAGYDEHPPQKPDPAYVQRGQDLAWQRVSAVVDAGLWQDTVFILTWDDWGGYADHVDTPDAETVPDQLHPNGFQVIGGSRIPLLMFGGQVGQGIESNWHSHASIPRTVIDLLQLPGFGVPRVDQAASLAAGVDASLRRDPPPPHGATVTQPAPPVAPKPSAPQPWGGPVRQLMPDLVGNGGKVIPAPRDGVVRSGPPQLPTEAG